MAKKRDDRSVENIDEVPNLAGAIDGSATKSFSGTPCEQLKASEITVPELAISHSDRLEWRMLVCNSPGRAVLRLMSSAGVKVSLVDQNVPPPNPIRRLVTPPALPPGRFVLYWGLLVPPGTDWQNVVELAVNETVVFRHFKSSQSNEPFPKGFMYVTVLP